MAAAVGLGAVGAGVLIGVASVADFLLAPGRRRLRWAATWASTVFPALWAVYTLVRGELVGWYPYFFLDPALVGGYRAVGTYEIGRAHV